MILTTYVIQHFSRPKKQDQVVQAENRKLLKSEALFSWFIDVRETLKGRLPRRLFKLKAQQLYTDWLAQNLVPVWSIKVWKYVDSRIEGGIRCES